MTESFPTTGVVVMAYGGEKFLKQAQCLALSLAHNCPTLHRTLITDAPGSPIDGLFDSVLPMQASGRRDSYDKLRVDLYSPYERTIYLDTDCLVIGDLTKFFASWFAAGFTVYGSNASNGFWHADVNELRKVAGSRTIPKFNAGLMCFEASSRTQAVFRTAREFADRYDRSEFGPFHGGFSDEPLLSIALATRGFAALKSDPTCWSTLVGLSGPIRINAIRGHCEFRKRSHPKTPAVVHFVGDFSHHHALAGSHYRRECLRLRLAARHVPPAVAALIAHAVHGLGCLVTNLHLRLTQRAPGQPRPANRPIPQGETNAARG